MKKQILISLLLLIGSNIVLACDSPDKLAQRFTAAVEAMDVDAIAAQYSEDAVMFAVDDMRGVGPDYIRNSWKGFFSKFKVLEVTLIDSHHENFGDSAVAWGLWKMNVVPVEGGETIPMLGRYMDVSRNFDGTWKYIADHASVPFMPPAEE